MGQDPPFNLRESVKSAFLRVLFLLPLAEGLQKRNRQDRHGRQEIRKNTMQDIF